MNISGIYIYPIKSLGGVSLNKARLTTRGLKYDRRYVLTDTEGMFLTQRQFPKMALFQIISNGMFWEVSRPDLNLSPIRIPKEARDSTVSQVQVWKDQVDAVSVSPAIDQWFSEALGSECRLMYMPDSSHRQVDPEYAAPGEIVSFADGYPTLIIGEASLGALNQRLEEPVFMNRFRPNLVFSGGTPHCEDTWKQLTIGDIEFRAVKQCGRCKIITIEQETATQGTEPLRTLREYRQEGKKVLFGMNLLHGDSGMVRLGDEIKA